MNKRACVLLVGLLLPLVMPACGQVHRKSAFKAIREQVEIRKDIVYCTAAGKDLKLDMYRPKVRPAQPLPVIVYIHGGGFMKGSKGRVPPFSYALAAEGYAIASLDYRLSGEAGFPAQIQDCKCAIRFLRAHAKEYGLDGERIGLWGGSAGGYLASFLGTSGDAREFDAGQWLEQSSRAQAVCDLFGPADYTVWSGRAALKMLGAAKLDEPALKELKIRASPISYVSKDDPPFLIMHGTKDSTVPFEQSVRFAKALESAGVRVKLTLIDGAGHGGTEIFTRETVREIRAFFNSNLKPAVPKSRE